MQKHAQKDKKTIKKKEQNKVRSSFSYKKIIKCKIVKRKQDIKKKKEKIGKKITDY